MNENREDFKDAADWEKKYSPIKRGHGTRFRCNGTLFERQGEDRKFINRMEQEFVWSVFHNGAFEYIQAGRPDDNTAVGYLVTDNPVFFTDLNSKFAVGYQMIDWKAFESGEDLEAATDEVPDTGDLTAAAPDITVPVELPTDIANRIEQALAPTKMGSVGKKQRPGAPAPTPPKKTDSQSNPLKRLVRTFLRKAGGPLKASTSRLADPVRAVPVAPSAPISSSSTQAQTTIPTLMPTAMSPPMSPASAAIPPNAAPIAQPAATPLAPEVAPACMPTPAPAAASLSPEMTSTATPTPAHNPADSKVLISSEMTSARTPASRPTTATVRPVSVRRPKPRPVRPQPTQLPFPLLAPASSPAPDPLPTQDRSAAAVRAMQQKVRYLPFGIDASKLDRQVYGAWPNAIVCKDCGGTGYAAKVVVGLIPCDECDGRGWNPPPGAPSEITVSMK